MKQKESSVTCWFSGGPPSSLSQHWDSGSCELDIAGNGRVCNGWCAKNWLQRQTDKMGAICRPKVHPHTPECGCILLFSPESVVNVVIQIHTITNKWSVTLWKGSTRETCYWEEDGGLLILLSVISEMCCKPPYATLRLDKTCMWLKGL